MSFSSEDQQEDQKYQKEEESRLKEQTNFESTQFLTDLRNTSQQGKSSERLVEDEKQKVSLNDKIFKHAWIQFILNKHDRSSIQNYDTMQWLKKRHKKNTKNQYLNLPEQIKEELYFKTIFDVFDEDGQCYFIQARSNQLDWKELYQLFRKYGIQIQRRQIKDFFRLNKTKEIGKLNLEEFKQFSSNSKSEELFRHIIRSILKEGNDSYDPEGNNRQNALNRDQNKYRTKSTKIFEKKLQIQRQMTKENNLDDQLQQARKKICEEVYNDSYTERQKTQPMSIDIDSIQNISEYSEESEKKQTKGQSSKKEDRSFSGFVPYTFGTMMSYLCYKEKRKKLLAEIENEQDIFVKYNKFYELLNMQGINEVDRNNGIANEYKQRLHMQTKVNLDKEMKQQVLKKIDFQKAFQIEEERKSQLDILDENKDEINKNELADQIYIKQLEGIKNRAEFQGKSQAQSEVDNYSFPELTVQQKGSQFQSINQGTFRSIKSYHRGISSLLDSKLKDQSQNDFNDQSNTIETIAFNKNVSQQNPVMKINDEKGLTKLLCDNANQFKIQRQKDQKKTEGKKMMEQLKKSELKLPVLQNITKQHTIPYENVTMEPRNDSIDRLLNRFK